MGESKKEKIPQTSLPWKLKKLNVVKLKLIFFKAISIVKLFYKPLAIIIKHYFSLMFNNE